MEQWIKRMASFIWVAACVLIALQIVLIFFLINQDGIEWVRYLGYATWVATCVFGWLPMYTLRKKGGVPEGKGYTHTTVVVDAGIYAIVRHPQYLGFMLLSLSLILISQNWITTIIGVLAMTFSYLIAVNADYVNLGKFGDDYRRYIEAVPRTNFLLGIIRLIRRRGKDES